MPQELGLQEGQPAEALRVRDRVSLHTRPAAGRVQHDVVHVRVVVRVELGKVAVEDVGDVVGAGVAHDLFQDTTPFWAAFDSIDLIF